MAVWHFLAVFIGAFFWHLFSYRHPVTGGYRKLHNEELHNIITVIKSRRMRKAGYVACIGEMCI
jgi:hypothetical protein